MRIFCDTGRTPFKGQSVTFDLETAVGESYLVRLWISWAIMIP